MDCKMDGCAEPRVGTSNYCVDHRPPPPRSANRPASAKPKGSEWSTNSQLMCPHCQERGHVRTRQVKVKRGVSGGKATGAVLTGGLSLFATGLSRKQQATEMRCGNCQTTWLVA